MAQLNPLYPPWYTKEDIKKSIDNLNECITYKINNAKNQKRSDNNDYNFTPFDVSTPTIDKNIVDHGGYYIGKIY